MLIGIAGPAGAGKDTMANWLMINRGMTKDHFAKPIKQMLNVCFGWTMDQWDNREWKEAIIPKLGFSPRFAAQKLGTEWRDAMGDDLLWAKALLARHSYGINNVVIADVRFKHEQQWIKDGQGMIVQIIRPDLKPIAGSDHASETSLDQNLVDHVFLNKGDISNIDQEFSMFFDIIFKG